jgi:site-specific DNA-methyltransferase (cytosine-N4-specific)
VNLTAEVFIGDNRETLKQLPDKSVQTVVTSPPYWGLRDYGEDEQIGLEESPQDFVEQLCLVFDEIWRVLKDDGTIWVNLGDSYAGSGKGSPGNFGKHAPSGSARHLEHKHSGIVPDGLKPKDLVGIPWRFAFAMQDRGWYLRQDIIWAKPNPMPESVTDRCTKSHEYIFLLTKNAKYYYDNEAIQEAGVDAESKRNKRSVWQVTTSRYKDAHFATYPPELITPCILAGSKENDIVLDPFSGSGTTGEVALLQNRNYIGLELSPEYAKLSEKRLLESGGMFASVSLR